MEQSTYLNSVFGLTGKTILVTGAGGGIGLAISEGLANAGAEVALCNRTVSKCQPLADRINAAGGRATVHHLDITSLDSIRACVDARVSFGGTAPTEVRRQIAVGRAWLDGLAASEENANK